MGATDPDFWAKEWPVIRDAPHLVLGGGIILIAAAVSITWFFVNWGYRHRLKLADERAKWANEVRDDIIRQFKDFKADIAAGAGIDALTARVARLEASNNELAAANNAVRSAIGITVGTSTATSITPLALRAAQAETDKDRPK